MSFDDDLPPRRGPEWRTELGEQYRAAARQARERNRRRLVDWMAQLDRLRAEGKLDSIVAFTPHHVRVRRGDVELDVWPSRAKWRDRKNQKAPTMQGWRTLLRALGLAENEWGKHGR